MSIHKARPEYEVAYQDLVALLLKHADKLTALELLAVAANMVGKMIAMQDQRTVTQEIALKVIAKNIEAGNQHAVAELLNGKGGTA